MQPYRSSNRTSLTLPSSVYTAAVFVTSLACAGCTSYPASNPGSRATEPATAERLAIDAGRLLESDPKQAEMILLRAIALDPYCGIAHNNLGTLQLEGRTSQGGPDLYAAAESFQTAARLLPGRADPRVNLGLIMERVGRINDALAAYGSAVESAPAHIGALQALTSLEIRSGRSTELTKSRLETIALEGTDASWRSWAKDQLLRSDHR